MGSVVYLIDKEVLGVGVVIRISIVFKGFCIGLVLRMILLRSGDIFLE